MELKIGRGRIEAVVSERCPHCGRDLSDVLLEDCPKAPNVTHIGGAPGGPSVHRGPVSTVDRTRRNLQRRNPT